MEGMTNRSTDREDDHGKGSEEKRSGTEEAKGQQEKEGPAGVGPEHSVEQGEAHRALIAPVEIIARAPEA